MLISIRARIESVHHWSIRSVKTGTWTAGRISFILGVSIAYGVWFDAIDSVSCCPPRYSVTLANSGALPGNEPLRIPIGEIFGGNVVYQAWNILGHLIPAFALVMFYPKKFELFIAAALISSTIMDSPIWGIMKLYWHGDDLTKNMPRDNLLCNRVHTRDFKEWIFYYYDPKGQCLVWNEAWPSKDYLPNVPNGTVIFWSIVLRGAGAGYLIWHQNKKERKGEEFSLLRLVGLSRQQLYPSDDTLPDDISSITFDHKDSKGNPVKFLWGVATSSYQVEGNITTNDWDTFTNSDTIRSLVAFRASIAKIDLHLESPGKAVDHWNLDVFSQDLERAKSLGINAYRLSVEWSRIQPNNSNDFDSDAIQHYRKMLNLIVQNCMTPILTLNHITLPKWVLTPPETFLGTEDEGFRTSLGGWENPATVDAFVKFVQFVVPKFKDVVNYWITINEPVGSIMGAGYLAGIWSPGFFAAADRAKKVLFNLVEAHVRAYDAIKGLAGAGAQVGFAHAMVFPKVSQEPDLFGNNMEAAAQWDYCFNRFFLEAVIEGIENKEVLLSNRNTRVRDDWRGRLDFVGINYYRSIYIKSIFPVVPWFGGLVDEDMSKSNYRHNCLNDLGWEIYPGGLYRFLKYLDKRFHLPILITENGFAEASDGLPGSGSLGGKRASYIVAHLAQVLHAIKEKVNVLGYVHWSIVDNWEWAYDYLPKARFGLYTVNRDVVASTVSKGEEILPRTKTQGAAALEYIISQRKMADAEAKFGRISPAGDK